MTGWRQWFGRLLETDPRDVGCDETIAVLHVYVELLEDGAYASDSYPGVAAHLAACESCSAITLGLLAAVQGEAHDI
mgnify:CR=1 FL=1